MVVAREKSIVDEVLQYSSRIYGVWPTLSGAKVQQTDITASCNMPILC